MTSPGLLGEIAILGSASPARHLARRFAARGYSLRVWDPDPDRAQSLAQDCGGRAEPSLPALVGAMTAPRLIWLCSDSAESSSRCLDQIGNLLDSGDAVVEAGEADFRQLPAGARSLDARGVALADAALVAGDWAEAVGRVLAAGSAHPVPGAMAAGLDAAADVPRGVWMLCGPPGSARFLGRIAAEGLQGFSLGLAEGFETFGRAGIQLQPGDLLRSWQHSGERNAALGKLAKDYLDAIAWDGTGAGVPPPAVALAANLRFASQGLESYLAQLAALMGKASPGAGPSR